MDMGAEVINRIYTYLAMAGGFVVTLILAFTRGKSQGKQQTEAKQNEQQLEAIKTVQKRIHKAGNVTADDVRDELRKGDF